MINSLFDAMITYRLDELSGAVKAIQDAEAKLAGNNNADAAKLIAEARALVNEVPVTEAQASESDSNSLSGRPQK